MRFSTDSLLSKWGFGDGDMLDDLLYDNKIEVDDFHQVLIKVVKEKILPMIVQKVEVYEICTIHNPIRAERVDGKEVNNYKISGDIKIKPEFIDVNDNEIINIAKKIQQMEHKT